MIFGALDRLWRLGATAFAFALFGLSAVGLSVTAFPLIALLTRDRHRRSARVQYLLHLSCRLYLAVLRGLGLLSWRVEGREHLRGSGQMIVANHPSLIDVLFLLAWLPQADCIMKASLSSNPFLRWTVAWAGYLGNATPDGLIDDCVAVLRAGRTLIVFPEGTRSIPGQPRPFKRGAARIALASDAELVPVRIRCAPPTLIKHQPWWQIPAHRPHFDFEIGAPFRVARLTKGDAPAKAARDVSEHLQRLLAPLPSSSSNRQAADDAV